nr:hypothetical protein CICLE_v10026873mg [Ipomoea trifida]GMC62959.1 protein IDA-LIKE 2 [Ipomoea batatas]
MSWLIMRCSAGRGCLGLLLCLALIFSFSLSSCVGSRSGVNVFKIGPGTHRSSTGHFLNFLPKRFPIPASGPSRKHNEIGLQTFTTSSSLP